MQEINGNRIFLNSEVEEEVIKDISLYIFWRLTQPTYDWEIDPLHNKNYVADQKINQKFALTQLKNKIEIFKKEFEEIDLHIKNESAKSASI